MSKRGDIVSGRYRDIAAITQVILTDVLGTDGERWKPGGLTTPVMLEDGKATYRGDPKAAFWSLPGAVDEGLARFCGVKFRPGGTIFQEGTSEEAAEKFATYWIALTEVIVGAIFCSHAGAYTNEHRGARRANFPGYLEGFLAEFEGGTEWCEIEDCLERATRLAELFAGDDEDLAHIRMRRLA